MQHHLLCRNSKAEYTTAWRTDVKEARNAARIPSCRQVLFLLWLTALLLQVVAASLRHYINPDGISYLHTANDLVAGDLEKGLSNFGVNTFIYMLALFERLGLDPFYTGVWWNAIISSLVVLPLFGWVRRMFDKRIAAIASLLYAFHPIVLSIGSALMRDPMFWLFFHATIYGTWRAITEIRLRWFLMAGCCLTLAIHTRSEAWFLLIPILLWVSGRFCFATGYRLRLCLETLLLLAIVPGSITVMNMTVLKSCPQWGIFRPSHLRQLAMVYDKIHEKLRKTDDSSENVVKPSASSNTSSTKPSEKTDLQNPPPRSASAKPYQKTESTSPPSFVFVGLRRAVLRLVKSYSYLYVIYLLIGIGVWRAWRYFATNAMFLIVIPLFGLIWYKSCNRDISPRYFLPVVLVSLPVIAIGVLAIVQKIMSSSKKSLCGLVAVMAFTLVVNSFSTIWGTNLSEQKECELGKWVRKRFGPDQPLCCINRKSRMAAWYAKTEQQRWKDYPVSGPNKKIVPPTTLAAIFKKAKPLVVLCWENHRTPTDMTGLFETLQKNDYYGYRVVRPNVLAEYEPKVLVLVRKDAL